MSQVEQRMRDALEHVLRVFHSMADRGAYPLELIPMDAAGAPSVHFLGKQGWQFVTDALAPNEPQPPDSEAMALLFSMREAGPKWAEVCDMVQQLERDLTSSMAKCAGLESSVLHLSGLVDELRAERDALKSWKARRQVIVSSDLAAALAHRGCCSEEHDPANGKLHGFCVVCGVPWPCETARHFMRQSPPQSLAAEEWQPIECAPKDGKAFLVHCPEFLNTFAVYRKEAFYGDDFLMWGAFERRLDQAPTHWMPFPPDPAPIAASAIA